MLFHAVKGGAHVTNGQTKKTEGQAGNELSFANEY